MAEVLEADQLEDTLKGRYLTFAVGKEVYGIEIQYVTEIIGLQQITAVPELPEYISGIINLRGKIIPVMDMKSRFKRQFTEQNDRTCIIVIDILNHPLGLIVDSVEEVISISDSEIVSSKETNLSSNKFMKGIGKVDNNVKLLLDCTTLLTINESNNSF